MRNLWGKGGGAAGGNTGPCPLFLKEQKKGTGTLTVSTARRSGPTDTDLLGNFTLLRGC